MLPEEAYSEFKSLYLEEFGIELSDEEVITKANSLLSIFRVFTRPQKGLDNDQTIRPK